MIEYECGYSSITEDNKHVLLWDFDVNDIIYLDKITSFLKYIQKHYKLSDIYLLKSRGGFNAISLDKCTKKEAFNIKLQTKKCDKLHNKFGYDNNSWVLRIGIDKHVIDIIKNIGKYQKSNAHRLLLNNLFNLHIKDGYDYDDNTKIVFERFRATSTDDRLQNGTLENIEDLHDRRIKRITSY